MNRKILISIVTIATFLIARKLKYFWAYAVFGKDEWNLMDERITSSILVYSQIVLVLIVCFLLFKKDIFKSLGLDRGIGKGFLVGLIATVPMIIGYAFINDINLGMDLHVWHKDFVLAGFFEEFMFRGFLFGILFYYAGWGFIPAIVIPSFYFGIGHLYQANTFGESVNVFVFTGLASAGFAWFYTAWRNLWVVVFLHAFMDLIWDVFQIETNVAGDMMVNLFRFTTLGLMIFLSIRNLNAHPEYSLKNKWWLNKG